MKIRAVHETMVLVLNIMFLIESWLLTYLMLNMILHYGMIIGVDRNENGKPSEGMLTPIQRYIFFFNLSDSQLC
jgi:hypothetical protein